MSVLPSLWRKIFSGGPSPTAVEDTPEGRCAELQAASGARTRSESDEPKLELKKKLPARCVVCKRFMSRSDGFYIYIDTDWKLHTKCFEKLVDKHLEKGEVIDFTTGNIQQLLEVDEE